MTNHQLWVKLNTSKRLYEKIAEESVVGYLRQDPAFEQNATVRQIFDQFSTTLAQLKRRMEILESQMSEETDEANLAEIMAEYGQVQEEFQMLTNVGKCSIIYKNYKTFGVIDE